MYEWGQLLTSVTSRDGLHPGELDRVFWNALQAPNFLQSSKSRYRGFAILDENSQQNLPKLIRFFESINEDASQINVVTLREG